MTTILQINQDDLECLFRRWRGELKAEAEAEAEEKANGSLVNPKNVEERLDVSSSTLWRWDKAGYLSPIYIGGRKMYRASDINALIEQGGAQ
ncbi:MAG: helix-turn-helix domain-containing protein [Rikenellaceae bacterium]